MTRMQRSPVTAKLRDMEESTGSGNRDTGLFGAELIALLRPPKRDVFYLEAMAMIFHKYHFYYHL